MNATLQLALFYGVRWGIGFSGMDVVPLAIKPLTLDLLLRSFQRTGGLPAMQSELYERGCRLLCEEASESRRDAGRMGTLSTEQRMRIASRIAAVTIFANKYAVWIGVDRGDVPTTDVVIQDLCGGEESAEGRECEVTDSGLRETLSTGLFSSRGVSRLGWAHQTYAEFLAAWYAVQREMTVIQVMGLVANPEDPSGKLVPQLHGVLGWLATMVPGIFGEVMKREPEVLLLGDVASARPEDQSVLVGTLLRLYEEGELFRRDPDIERHYGKLAYDGLAAQLRPYIRNSTRSETVRRVAIDIAEACALREIQSDLADLALADHELLAVRVDAAYAVVRIGDEKTKTRLAPLAIPGVEADKDDELKGCALRAVWPQHMSAEELFSVLTVPKRTALLGAYQSFIGSRLVQHLNPSDLPTALTWVEGQGSLRTLHGLACSFTGLCNAIMLSAWNHLQVPGVLHAFAAAALRRLRDRDEIAASDHDTEFADALQRDESQRRRLLEAMIPMISDPGRDSIVLVHSRTPVVLNNDVPWMIERLERSESREAKQVWTYLIQRAFDPQLPEQLDAIIVACRTNPVLAEAFASLISPIELDSPEAASMRAAYEEEQQWLRRDQEEPTLDPPLGERISTLLDECESGDSDAWWRLNREMTLEPGSTHYGDEREPNLRALPGWKEVGKATRQRIVLAAKKYLAEGESATGEWLGQGKQDRRPLAGYRSFCLLLKESPDFVAALAPDTWRKWAPAIVAYPVLSHSDESDLDRKLVGLAYRYAPDELIDTLLILIDEECERLGNVFVISRLADCWDERLAGALLTKASSDNLKPECMGTLLATLLDHRLDGARELASSLLRLPPDSDGNPDSRAVIAGRVLVIHTEDAGWSVVWPVMQQNTKLGLQVIAKVAHAIVPRETGSLSARLTEDRLADLYVWLAREYPTAENRGVDGKYWDSVGMLRDSILADLGNRGTSGACDAIRRIQMEFPGLERLKWDLVNAETVMRRAAWMPPKPAHVLALGRGRHKRLVQDGTQLLEVLIESLWCLEKKLQGETPTAEVLWNEVKKSTWEPKPERLFSDYVKTHLEDDLRRRGVVVNREVQIHGGERTDIHVDAVVRDEREQVHDTVSVIIEAKGCWNPRLNEEMETQLKGRYLRDNRCQHGLYLVGWFNCDKWSNGDYKKQHAPPLNVADAQKQFDCQADKLSGEGTLIKALVLNTALP